MNIEHCSEMHRIYIYMYSLLNIIHLLNGCEQDIYFIKPETVTIVAGSDIPLAATIVLYFLAWKLQDCNLHEAVLNSF